MGVQTLWFMPINPIGKEGRKGALGSYYAISDYRSVNPEFGSMEDWKNLVNKIHSMGMKVIIDWVPNHTSPDHPWVKKHPDFFIRDSVTGIPVHQPGTDWTDTRKLDFKNRQLWDSTISSMKYWVTETGIDGFRCDTAGYCRERRNCCRTCAEHRRPELSQRLRSVMEFECSAGSWEGLGGNGWLLRKQRNAPSHFEKHQSTNKRWRSTVYDAFTIESDPARCGAKQHRADRRIRKLQLQRTVVDC
jgi:glycosidase